MTPAMVAQSVAECGVGFMYAPMNHPAMKTVAPVRKALGVRTAFNLLGPMTNAASAQHVVIGVFEESLVELMARTLIGTYVQHVPVPVSKDACTEFFEEFHYERVNECTYVLKCGVDVLFSEYLC
jgi:anthranilate phosphoribosyltransferase